MTTKYKRFISLDVLRGLTILFMIVVNNPGYGGSLAQLRHKAWDGVTIADFVFPFFIFIVGASLYFALSRNNFELNGRLFGKIVKRTVLLFGIGYLLNALWFTTPIAEIRIMAVLQRIALVYFAACMVVLWLRDAKKIIPLTMILLLGYWALIHFTGSYEPSAENIVGRIDTAIVGESRMYHMAGQLFDPEGIVGTISSLCNALIGFLFAMLISKRGFAATFTWGVAVAALGLVWSVWFPFNKPLWSSSFVLITSGAGAILWALAYWLIDVRKKVAWSELLRVFGTNAIYAYIFSQILGKAIWEIEFMAGGNPSNVNGWLYSTILEGIMPGWCASLVWSLLIVGITWAVTYPLYRRKIYIKL